LFRGIEQYSVLKSLRSQFIRPHDFMTLQEPGKWSGGVGVKKDLHATSSRYWRGLLQGTFGEGEYLVHVVSIDGGKPFQKNRQQSILDRGVRKERQLGGGCPESTMPRLAFRYPVHGGAKT